MILRKAIFFYIFLPIFASAQQAVPPQPSPLALATARYKDTYVKVTYCQPHKKGREVFGKLVPYGQVWRTGANQATEITVTRDIQISGNLLRAGTYSLFTIPDKEKWTVIFNTDLGMWGSYNYNPKSDVFRIDVPVGSNIEMYEPFTITIDQKNDKAEVIMQWDHVRVSLPVQFFEPKP